MEFVWPKSVREHGVQVVASDFKKTACFAPFRSHIGFLRRGSRGSLHREESNAVCPIKIGWKFLQITGEGGGGAETSTPQTELFRARQE